MIYNTTQRKQKNERELVCSGRVTLVVANAMIRRE